MPRFKPKSVLETSAISDLWKHTLSRIPTLFGRLAYLASLRDANSGIYRHHGLGTVFGREESGKALRESHEQAFIEWLKLSLAQKYDDLVAYLAVLEDPQGADVKPAAVAENWLRSGIYRTMAPNAARPVESELYCRDLEALLEMIRISKRPAESGPASLPLESPDR
jgi:hypothetical protein